jgi:hypothetical protein
MATRMKDPPMVPQSKADVGHHGLQAARCRTVPQFEESAAYKSQRRPA